LTRYFLIGSYNDFREIKHNDLLGWSCLVNYCYYKTSLFLTHVLQKRVFLVWVPTSFINLNNLKILPWGLNLVSQKVFTNVYFEFNFVRINGMSELDASCRNNGPTVTFNLQDKQCYLSCPHRQSTRQRERKCVLSKVCRC